MKTIPKVELKSATELTAVELNHLHFATAHSDFDSGSSDSDPIPAGSRKQPSAGVKLTVHPSVTVSE